MRCAVYARYSSDMQKPTSCEDQIRECGNAIKDRGWKLLNDHIYKDEAVSGYDIDRLGYNELKNAAAEGCFDYIFVDDLSRFGRNTAESIMAFQELTIHNVNIMSVADSLDTANESAKIPYYFKSIMNEFFLDDLKKKVRRGLKGQISRGFSAGGRLYGYDRKEILSETGEKDKTGRPLRHGVKMTIKKQEKEVILYIFRMRSTGLGYRTIVDKLNSDGIPSPHSGSESRSGYWNISTVRGILNQEKYIGRWTWNKYQWIRNNITGKRIKRRNPKSDWITHEDESLRIVPQNLWDKVQSINRRASTASDAKRLGGRNGSYLLSGLLKCISCGSSWIVINSGKYSSMVCNGYWSKGATVCGCGQRLLRNSAEQLILDRLGEICLSDAVLNELTIRANQALKRKCQKKGSVTDLAKKEVQVKSQIENLLKLAENGNITDSLRSRLQEKESELKKIRMDINRHNQKSEGPRSISKAWIRKVMQKLFDYLNQKSRPIREINAALKNIFPHHLTIDASKKAGKTEFIIKGLAMPFNGLQGTTSPIMLSSPTGNRTPV